MKKKILLIIAIILAIIALSVMGLFIYGLAPASSSEDTVLFEVSSGQSKLDIVKNMKTADLINSELVLDVYLFFHSDMILQAGTYEFQKNDSPVEMLKKMSNGEVYSESVTVLLVEGKRLSSYVTTLSEALGKSEDSFYSVLSDEDFLNELIEKYWFITSEILQDVIYYPLEGYLYPDTYEFDTSLTVEQVIYKILDNTNSKLTSLQEQIENSSYTVHEILSMAAIIELEAVTEDDRATVSQVIYKRLESNMTLGMDVTTYYAVKKEMGESLTISDINTVNPYNTRDTSGAMNGKLPVGPICSPSLESINAALNPSDTDYLYFYADVTTGKVYFSSTYEEHLQIQKEVG